MCCASRLVFVVVVVVVVAMVLAVPVEVVQVFLLFSSRWFVVTGTVPEKESLLYNLVVMERTRFAPQGGKKTPTNKGKKHRVGFQHHHRRMVCLFFDCFLSPSVS